MTAAAVQARPPAADLTFHRWMGWAVGLGAFALYTATCCPTVHWGDSGELIVAGVVLGIAHPPGHPLFSMLGHLFSWLPLATPAWRVNWMSAVFGAVAVGLTYELAAETLRRLGAPPRRAAGCAAAAAALFAVTSGLWGGSTVAETTALHAAFTAGVVWLVWRIAWTRPTGATLTQALGAAAVLYGFSATNHVAGIFFLPAFAVLLVARCGREVLHPRNVCVMVACVLAGLSLYGFLPLRSLQNPPLDWANPETAKNFWWVITARQYQAYMTQSPAGFVAASQALGQRGVLIAQEWTGVGAVLVIAGVLSLGRRVPAFAAFVLLAVAPLIVLGLSSAFILAYVVPGMVLLAVALAVGFERVVGATPVLPAPVAAALAAALVAWSGVQHAGASARQTDRTADAYGRTLLAELPANAVLFSTNQPMLFVSWFLQLTEGYRTDVSVVDPRWLVDATPLTEQVRQAHPDLRALTRDELEGYRQAWGAETLSHDVVIAAVMAANRGPRPIYTGVFDHATEMRRHLAPRGGLLELRDAPGPYLDAATVGRSQAYWLDWEARLAADADLRRPELQEMIAHEVNNQGLFFESLDRDDLARWNYRTAARLAPHVAEPHLNRGRLAADTEDWAGAEVAYRTATTLQPENSRAHYYLGTALEGLDRFADAYRAYLLAMTWDPNDGDALRRAGLLLLRAGDVAQAESLLAWALNANPDDAASAQGLVRVAFARNELPAAGEALQRAQALDPDSVHALLLTAEYGARTGQTTARQALDEAFRIDPAYAAEATVDAPWAQPLLEPVGP